MWRQLLDQRFTCSLRTRFERLWHSPRSPSCRRSPLVFQPLEPRLLLSADLAPVEGVLEVVGTADDDSVLIRVLQERLSVVLNGESFEFALEDIKEIKVDLLGGDDALLLDGSAGVALPAVQIDLGEGDNRFDADLLNPVGTLNVAAGGGRDVLSTQARWDGAHPDFAWLPTYNPGAGDDSVHAEWSSVETFTFGDRGVDVDARVLAGDGNDRIAIDLSRMFVGATRAALFEFDLDGGPGDDVANVTMPVASRGGADQEPIDPAERRAPVSVRHDGRAGTDSFALIGGDAAEQYGLRAFDDPERGRSFEFAVADLGTGNPIAELAVLSVTNVALDAAGGDDVLNAEVALDANWDFALGDGADRTQIVTRIGDRFGDAHYSVRAGEGDNETLIRFGDGERGARPPSGETNITAEYRSGAGNDSVSFDWRVHLDRPLIVDVDASTGAGDDFVVTTWRQQHEFRSGKVALWDYNFDTGEGDDAVELRVAPGEGIDPIGVEVKVTADDPDARAGARIAFAEADGGPALGDVAVNGAEKLRLETGSGADRVMIDDVTGALRPVRLDVLTGAGDDEYLYVPVGRFAQYLEDSLGEGLQWAVFDGGEGHDRFALATSDRAERIEIDGLVVEDIPDPVVRVTDLATALVTLQASVLATESIGVDSAGGDDVLDFTLSGEVGGLDLVLDLVTGAGNDRAALLLPAVQAAREAANKVNVDLGDGDDTLQMDVLGTPPPDDTKPAEFRPAEFNILGGAGNDTVRYRFFAIVDRTTPSASEFDALIGLFIDLGNGDDLAEIDIDTLGVAAGITPCFDIGVHGGLGGDLVGIDARGVFDEFDLSVDLGADAAGRDIPTETLSLNFEEIRVDYHAQSEHRYQADGESERATAHYSLGLRSDGELVQAIHEAETIGGLVSDRVDIAIGGNQAQTVGSSLTVAAGNRGGAEAGDAPAGVHDLRVIFDGLDNAHMESAVSFVGGAAADSLFVDVSADDDPVHAFFKSVSGLASETEVVEYRAGAEIGDHLTLEVDMSGVDALAFLTGDADDEIEVELLHPTVPVPTLALTTQGGNDSISGSFLGVAGALGLALDTGDGDDDVDLSYTEAAALATGAGAGGLPHVKTFSGASAAAGDSLLAYGPQFTGGVRVALGDVNGDGVADLVTGAGPGGGPHVKVFDGRTGAETRSFFAYAASFTGGVNVASGDINDDGFADIITGADAGGGPHVKVFSGATGEELRSFFAYAPGFTGGVRVASGDVNGDGRDDIITGTGPGGGTHVKVFDGVTGAELRSFFAYPSFTGGVFVAAGDVDGDGAADVVTGAGAGGGPHVKVFSGATSAELHSFFAYAPSFTGGVRVASGDVNGDGLADIVTGAGPGAGPHVKVFDGATGAEIRSFFAYDPGFLGGVYVAAGDIDSDAPGRFDLALDTGAGNDAVTLQLMTGASRSDTIAADLGTGADRFALEWHGALQEPSVELQLQLEVALGGADTLLPEVGDEVLVSFEHGDPDRPLVLGTVWNSQDAAPEDTKRLEMTLAGSGGTLGLQSVLTGGSGSDQVTLFYAGTLRAAAEGQIDALIDLGNGDDALTIDLTGLQTVGPKKLAPIAVDARGGSGRDTLVVTGTEGNDHFTLTESAVILEGAASANFAGFEAVQVYALGGNDRVTMTGLDPRIDWLVDGGAGRDRFFARFDDTDGKLTLLGFESVKLKKAR